MTTYSFKVTKGRYQLSLTTTDRDMIVEEFEKWVKSVADYVQKNKGHESVSSAKKQVFSERELTQRKIDEELKRVSKSEPMEEAPISEKEETQKDLDTIFASARKEEASKPTIETNNENVQNVFDTILDRSMQTPQSELSFKPNPSIKKDNAFLNYISGRKVERKIDYLLMTAYYFTQYEQKPRFTLKQLNAKLMQNIAIILDHSVVQEAINREYLECLPDLTGVVGASEYRLTAYGEKILLEEG
jgi:hypothetical protein